MGAAALGDVLAERRRQDGKFGPQNHNPIEWMAILGEEFGEASKEAVEIWFAARFDRNAHWREEMVQVAATALAIVEAIDRNTMTWTKG